MSGIPAGAGQLLGKRLGKFEIVALLALGGTAEIYLARIGGAAGFEKYVVVKCLHDHLADDAEFVKMFLDEARLAAHLDHSNIVQTMELGQHDGRYYMVMEFLAGLSLAMIVRRASERLPGARVPVPLVLNILAQSCAGLHYAHEKAMNGKPLNIVHRDISPQNLVISFEGVVKIVDFGIAKAEMRETRTRSGTIKGKFAYMSPEQCVANNVDRRTDVFALGVIGHELLTGRRLFKRPSPYETYQAVIECDVKPPSELDPAIDPALDRVIMAALTKDKDARYPTAEAFGDALLGYLHHRGIGSGPGDVSRFFDSFFHQEIDEHSARMRELISGRDISVDTGVNWGGDDEVDAAGSSGSLRVTGEHEAKRPSAGSLSGEVDLGVGSRVEDDDEMPAERTRIESNPLERVNEMHRELQAQQGKRAQTEAGRPGAQRAQTEAGRPGAQRAQTEAGRPGAQPARAPSEAPPRAPSEAPPRAQTQGPRAQTEAPDRKTQPRAQTAAPDRKTQPELAETLASTRGTQPQQALTDDRAGTTEPQRAQPDPRSTAERAAQAPGRAPTASPAAKPRSAPMAIPKVARPGASAPSVPVPAPPPGVEAAASGPAALGTPSGVAPLTAPASGDPAGKGPRAQPAPRSGPAVLPLEGPAVLPFGSSSPLAAPPVSLPLGGPPPTSLPLGGPPPQVLPLGGPTPPPGRFPDLANLPTMIAVETAVPPLEPLGSPGGLAPNVPSGLIGTPMDAPDPAFPPPPDASEFAHVETHVVPPPPQSFAANAPTSIAPLPPGMNVDALPPPDAFGNAPTALVPPPPPAPAIDPLAGGYPVMNAQLSQQIATGATVFPSARPGATPPAGAPPGDAGARRAGNGPPEPGHGAAPQYPPSSAYPEAGPPPAGGFGPPPDPQHAGAFGQPDHPQHGGAFGQPDHPQHGGSFGQPDHPQHAGGFGQPDHPQHAGGFGQSDHPQHGGARGPQDRPPSGAYAPPSGAHRPPPGVPPTGPHGYPLAARRDGDPQRAADLLSPVGPAYGEQVDWAEAAAKPARATPPWLLAVLFIAAIGIALALTVIVSRAVR